MKIIVENRQKALALRPAAVGRLARALAARAFEGEEAYAEIRFLLTDDASMPFYKESCFGLRVQTDVVTQSYEAVPGVCGATAEVAVNVERAAREGARRAGGAARELALYVAHGLDHLAGGEDDTPTRRRAMRRRETAWLDADVAAYEGVLA